MAEHEVWLRVQRGAVNDEEAAALVAALSLVRRASVSAPGTDALGVPATSAWARAARAGQRPASLPPFGPGAWRQPA